MQRTLHFDTAGATLWASAFIVAALLIMQAGRLASNPAYAEMTTTRGDFTLMTTDSGRGGDQNPWELLFVINSRDQALLVYEVESVRNRQIVLRDGGSLVNLFRRGRGG